MMTQEEFKDAMGLINEEYNDNNEDKHVHMDNLMCELLSSMGYEEGIDIFRDADKWYS